MKHANVLRTYSDCHDASLDDTIKEIKTQHLNAGEVMAMRHLRAKGFRMQRQTARDSQTNIVEECMMLRVRTMFGT